MNSVNSVLSSSIITANFDAGKAGKLVLDANQIEIVAGGNITSSVIGNGRGGDITVNATESITIKGFDENTFSPSLISSISFKQGNAGDLTINTARLKIQDSGRIDSTTFADGNAGNLQLNASESVEVTGASLNPFIPSSISSAAIINPVPIIREALALPDLPSGDSGSLTITTPQLKVADAAQITVQNDGLGSAGNLDIFADSIILEPGGNVRASTRSGNGGNINLNMADLLIQGDRSIISAEAKGTGNGGNITIDAAAIVIRQKSSIDASAFIGNGGNINIITQGLFISPDSRIGASSEFGLDGDIEIETLTGDRAIELEALPIKPIDTAEEITAGCNLKSDFAIAGKGGLLDNPTEYLRSETIWRDLRSLKINNSPINSQSQLLSASTLVREAQNWKINSQGKVELVGNQKREQLLSNYFQCMVKTTK